MSSDFIVLQRGIKYHLIRNQNKPIEDYDISDAVFSSENVCEVFKARIDLPENSEIDLPENQGSPILKSLGSSDIDFPENSDSRELISYG